MPDNRRVKMTKKMIAEAYLELLKEYPAGKISITKICNKADVNRSTFYAYYANIPLLREEMENDVLSKIPLGVESTEQIISEADFVDTLEKFFDYIRKHEKLFRALILKSDNIAFRQKLLDTVLEKYKIHTKKENSIISKYRYIYCVSGVIGILGNWIEDHFPINTREFAKMAYRMSFMAGEISKDNLLK